MWSSDSWSPSCTTTRTSTVEPRSVQNSFEQWNWCLERHAVSIEDSNSDRNVAFVAAVHSHGAIAACRSATGSALIACAAAAAGALSGCWATTKRPSQMSMPSRKSTPPRSSITSSCAPGSYDAEKPPRPVDGTWSIGPRSPPAIQASRASRPSL